MGFIISEKGYGEQRCQTFVIGPTGRIWIDGSDKPHDHAHIEDEQRHCRRPDLNLPIEDLDLSARHLNCFKQAQVNSIGELVEKTEEDLLAITNFGQKSLDEVIVKLNERGLSLHTRTRNPNKGWKVIRVTAYRDFDDPNTVCVDEISHIIACCPKLLTITTRNKISWFGDTAAFIANNILVNIR